MSKGEKITELRGLQGRADALREELGIAAPRAIIYKSDLDIIADDAVLVEADGFGGATTMVVEGNYPVDYSIKFEKFFPTEKEAEEAAEQLASHRGTARQVLDAV
jgi:hypothetical protein